MPHFGFVRQNAEVIETEERGDIDIVRVKAIGATRNAAIRGARREADALIPVRFQEVLNVTKEERPGIDDSYLVTISEEEY